MLKKSIYNKNNLSNFYSIYFYIPPHTSDQITVESCSEMNNVLQPLAIRFTAGLMYWFAVEAGMLEREQSKDNNKPDIAAVINLLLLD